MCAERLNKLVSPAFIQTYMKIKPPFREQGQGMLQNSDKELFFSLLLSTFCSTCGCFWSTELVKLCKDRMPVQLDVTSVQDCIKNFLEILLTVGKTACLKCIYFPSIIIKSSNILLKCAHKHRQKQQQESCQLNM